MGSNCTVERVIYENVEDTDMKFVLIILFILMGLKLRKKCKKDKETGSGTVSLQSV